MTEKYDLDQMLEEIKRDEQVITKRKNWMASQKDIQEMVAKRKVKKKKNDQVKS